MRGPGIEVENPRTIRDAHFVISWGGVSTVASDGDVYRMSSPV